MRNLVLFSRNGIPNANLPAGARIGRKLQESDELEVGCAYLDFSPIMQPNLLVYTGEKSNGLRAFDRYDLVSGCKIGFLTTDALNTACYLVDLPDGFLKNPAEKGSLPEYPPIDMRGRIKKLLEVKKGDPPVKE